MLQQRRISRYERRLYREQAQQETVDEAAREAVSDVVGMIHFRDKALNRADMAALKVNVWFPILGVVAVVAFTILGILGVTALTTRIP
jgi:hypothetical protein